MSEALRDLLRSALNTLQANHAWHQEYDEHGDYPESELCTRNETTIRLLLDELKK